MVFKKLFGKSSTEAEVQEQGKKQEKERKKEKKPTRARRYTLLVEDIFETSRHQGVMLLGNVHGKVKVGDTMYLYQKDRSIKEVEILAIELGPREVVESASNQQAALCVNLESKEEVSKFAVLNSVRPLPGALVNRIIENQRLLGLMMEYRRLYTNAVYMEELLNELCFAKFVVPLYMEQPPVPTADGKWEFKNDAPVAFRSLKKWDDETKSVFPAFTDEVALMGWKDAYQQGQPKRLATMQLPHIIEYVQAGGHAGFVANPYGPVSVYFPIELLKQVEESEVFREKYLPK